MAPALVLISVTASHEILWGEKTPEDPAFMHPVFHSSALGSPRSHEQCFIRVFLNPSNLEPVPHNSVPEVATGIQLALRNPSSKPQGVRSSVTQLA